MDKEKFYSKNQRLKLKVLTSFFDDKEKIAKVNQEIYSQGKGENSPAVFGYRGAKEFN